MPSPETLRKNREFQHVFRLGKSSHRSEGVFYALRTRRKKIRFGYCVSKKIGCAVVRNRLRRRLKEMSRLNSSLLAPGFDVVIVARAGMADLSYQQLERSFQDQLQRLGCWGGPLQEPPTS